LVGVVVLVVGFFFLLFFSFAQKLIIGGLMSGTESGILWNSTCVCKGLETDREGSLGLKMRLTMMGEEEEEEDGSPGWGDLVSRRSGGRLVGPDSF
jgi:hypothetical protein